MNLNSLGPRLNGFFDDETKAAAAAAAVLVVYFALVALAVR